MTALQYDPLALLGINLGTNTATKAHQRANVPPTQLVGGINPILGNLTGLPFSPITTTTPIQLATPSNYPLATVPLGNNPSPLQFQLGGNYEHTTTHKSINITRQDRQILMNLERKKQSNLPELAISSVSFFPYTDVEIIKMSVVKITNGNSLEGPMTVNDARMGTISENTACSTCHRSNQDCPGHHGRIELHNPNDPLSEPFYNPLFFFFIT